MSTYPPTKHPLAPGDVVTVRLPANQPGGHEQEGYRPAVIVGVPSLSGPTRFLLAIIVPVTTDRGQPWAAAHPALYPVLPAGTAGLPAASVVLADQVRALDLARVQVRRGRLEPAALALVAAAVGQALPCVREAV